MFAMLKGRWNVKIFVSVVSVVRKGRWEAQWELEGRSLLVMGMVVDFLVVVVVEGGCRFELGSRRRLGGSYSEMIVVVVVVRVGIVAGGFVVGIGIVESGLEEVRWKGYCCCYCYCLGGRHPNRDLVWELSKWSNTLLDLGSCSSPWLRGILKRDLLLK